jgi:AcrR family transcriptional regulator/NAD(P)-dependent dehydrogenase (short-subunit alcohol dehydrogenase family)
MTQISTTVKNGKLVEKRREQIVLTAIKLFSQKGFHKTTLKDLAAAAGLSYGNIYDYVGGKEDIIYLIHEYVYGLILIGLEQATAAIDNPIEKLRRMVRFEFSIMDQVADAILILYHYSHILKDEYLRKLLNAEREHIQRFETVIQACMDQGLIKKCNVRLNANLIKSMIDAWVLKRWDMRAHVTAAEAENEILGMALNGLMQGKEPAPALPSKPVHDLTGKRIFIANGGTVIGSAILSRLVSAHAQVAVYMQTSHSGREYPVSFEGDSNLRLFTPEQDGPLTPDLYEKIVEDWGKADIFIYDLGLGNTTLPSSDEDSLRAGKQLEGLLATAQELARHFLARSSLNQPDRIILVAPWQWDRYLNPLAFEITRAAAKALTHELSRNLSANGKNTHCLIPGFLKSPRPSRIEKELGPAILEQISARRLGKVDDLADAVMFLSSEASGYISGQVMHITGGTHSMKE